MPYKREDSPIWWASYTESSGKRIRRSTGTEDHKEAKALESKWRHEAHLEKEWEKAPARTFDELMLAYLNAHTSKRSAQDDIERTRKLLLSFAGRDMATIAGPDIYVYATKRRADGISGSTINRELSLLSGAIEWARKDLGWDLANPCRGRRQREPEGRVRWITREEADRLVKEARLSTSEYLPDLVIVALHTGMRRGELLGLEWDRVDLKSNLVHLSESHTKTMRRRSVPINATARAALLSRARFRAEHCPDSRWVFCTREGESIGEPRKCFLGACRRAGIDNFHFHDLRHTCAAWLVSSGVQIIQVRDLLGHTTITMTERYAHLAPAMVRSAVAVLDGGHDSVTDGFGEPSKTAVSR